MKKFSSTFKWLALAGFTGALYLTESRVALAQTENQPKQMKVKIIQNINGVETMRDTVIEVSGIESLPDLSGFRNDLSKLSAGDAKERELLLKKLRESGQLKEIKTLKSDFKEGELPTKLKVKVIKVEPGKDFKLDSLIVNRRLRIEEMERTGEPFRNEKFKMEFENLEGLDNENAIEMITKTGDSLMVFKRIILVKHDMTDEEKDLLNAKAKEKTSSGKIKDLNLESVDLYPNPNTGKFRVSFTAPKKGNTTVAIMDNTGRELYRENLGHFSGNFEKEYNLEAQPKGVYYLQVMQGKQVYNKKVLLQ